MSGAKRTAMSRSRQTAMSGARRTAMSHPALSLVTAALLLGGCTLAPDYRQPDSPVPATVGDAAAGADAVVSTGGVSVGDADHVRDVLGGGGHIDFWRLAIKPGRPFAYGRYRGLPFFGLPGNPVSSMVTFLLLVRPALLRLAGAAPAALPRIRVTLASDVRKAPGRRDFQRARRMDATTGAVRAHAFERQDSNVLSVLADADLLLDLPADAGDLPAGSEVHAIDLAGLLGPR